MAKELEHQPSKQVWEPNSNHSITKKKKKAFPQDVAQGKKEEKINHNCRGEKISSLINLVLF